MPSFACFAWLQIFWFSVVALLLLELLWALVFLQQVPWVGPPRGFRVDVGGGAAGIPCLGFTAVYIKLSTVKVFPPPGRNLLFDLVLLRAFFILSFLVYFAWSSAFLRPGSSCHLR